MPHFADDTLMMGMGKHCFGPTEEVFTKENQHRKAFVITGGLQ